MTPIGTLNRTWSADMYPVTRKRTKIPPVNPVPPRPDPSRTATGNKPRPKEYVVAHQRADVEGQDPGQAGLIAKRPWAGAAMDGQPWKRGPGGQPAA